jgi:hypothetical protein
MRHQPHQPASLGQQLQATGSQPCHGRLDVNATCNPSPRVWRVGVCTAFLGHLSNSQCPIQGMMVMQAMQVRRVRGVTATQVLASGAQLGAQQGGICRNCPETFLGLFGIGIGIGSQYRTNNTANHSIAAYPAGKKSRHITIMSFNTPGSSCQLLVASCIARLWSPLQRQTTFSTEARRISLNQVPGGSSRQNKWQ